MNTLLRLTLSATLILMLAATASMQAQTCASYTTHNISGGDASSSICYEFVRAFLIKNTNGSGNDLNTNTVPSAWEINQQDNTNEKYCEDSHFTLTTDPNEADVVLWFNGSSVNKKPLHAAVAFGDGTFISKQTGTNTYELHDLCAAVNGGAGNVRSMYTYRNRKRGLGISSSDQCNCFDVCNLFESCSNNNTVNCGGGGSSCIAGTSGTLNYSQTLQGYNAVSSYYNIVSLTTPCSELDWTKLYGNGSWSASSSGKTLWIYLDAGEYLFMEMSTPDESNINTFFFERPSGGGWYRVGQSASSLIHPNPFESYVFVPDTYLGSKLTIFDVQGKLVKQMEIRQQKVDLSDLGAGMYMLQGR
ncbi:MAG: T9SS type A sorting domain-containing protein, partial [Bacteroidota bacterium]